MWFTSSKELGYQVPPQDTSRCGYKIARREARDPILLGALNLYFGVLPLLFRVFRGLILRVFGGLILFLFVYFMVLIFVSFVAHA